MSAHGVINFVGGFEHDEWDDEKLALPPSDTFSRTELSSISSDHRDDADPNSVEDKDIMQVIGEKFLAIYDKSIRRRNLFNLILALTSIFLMMGEIWVAYDHEECWKDFLAERDACNQAALDGTVTTTTTIHWANISNGVPLAPGAQTSWTTMTNSSNVTCDDGGLDLRKKNCLRANLTTFILKCLLSANTLCLLYSIISYYMFQLRTEKGASWFITDSVMWREYVWVWLFVELLICVLHPFPAALDRSFVPYNDKFGLLMFMRVYLVIRPLRDFTPIYQQRGLLLHDSDIKKTGAAEFNWALSVKFLFLQHTWAFVIIGVACVWLAATYTVWVFEREVKLIFEEPYISLWMMMAAMSTVGYGDVSPEDAFSQVITGFAAVVGIILSALLVFAVMDSLTLTPQDVRVKNLWIRKKRQDDQRHAAASYIQLFWKHHVEKVRIKNDPAASSHMLGWFHSHEYQAAYLKFNRQNAILKGILRACRRDLSTAFGMDDLVIDRVEDKIQRMSTNIANRLAFRLGLRPHKRDVKELSTISELEDRVSRLSSSTHDALSACDKILRVVVSEEGHEDTKSVRRKQSSSWWQFWGGDSESDRSPSPPRRSVTYSDTVPPSPPRHRELRREDRRGSSQSERSSRGSRDNSNGDSFHGSEDSPKYSDSARQRASLDLEGDGSDDDFSRSAPRTDVEDSDSPPKMKKKVRKRVRKKKKKNRDDD